MANDNAPAKATSEILFVNPDTDLVVIGLDTADGPEHPNYDFRNVLPTSPYLLTSMLAQGYRGAPLLVSKVKGGKFAVVTGRQRVKAIREVNASTDAAHKHGVHNPIRLVPVQVVPSAQTRDLAEMENSGRQEDSAQVRAVKAQRYEAHYRSVNSGVSDDAVDAQIRSIFGCASTTLADWRRYCAMSPSAHAACDSGKWSFNAIIQLGNISHDECNSILAANPDGMSGTQAASAAKAVRIDKKNSVREAVVAKERERACFAAFEDARKAKRPMAECIAEQEAAGEKFDKLLSENPQSVEGASVLYPAPSKPRLLEILTFVQANPKGVKAEVIGFLSWMVGRGQAEDAGLGAVIAAIDKRNEEDAARKIMEGKGKAGRRRVTMTPDEVASAAERLASAAAEQPAS